VFSQEMDSVALINNLNKATDDTQKTNALCNLSDYYLNKDLNKALSYAEEAKSISKKSNYKEGISKSEFATGEANFLLSNFDEAKINYTEALSVYSSLKNDIGIADSYSGLGKVAYKIGESDIALDHFKKALEIFENKKHKKALPGLYINIGLLYDDVKNYKQAIEFYNKSVTIGKEINDEAAIASAYTNLGSIYIDQKQVDIGIEYLNRSLILKTKLGNKKGIGVTLNNLGAAFFQIGNYEKALLNFEKAYAIYMEVHDKKSIFSSCTNIGSIHQQKGDHVKALEYFNKAYDIIQTSPSVSKRIICLENLAIVHKALGNSSKALEYAMKSSALKDTLYDKNQAEITTEMQTKFASEKKQQENEILNLQVKSESFLKTIFIIAAFLLLVVAFFIYKGSRQKHKINKALNEKNTIIEEQKHIVEVKQKEILDSIHYAKRIQTTLLANQDFLDTNLQSNFVLFKPKDIVSGDFYWATKHDNKLFLAVCDSTGHGVPGAFMSLLSIGFLSEAINEKNILEPHLVFNYVRERLINSISNEGQQDGFDGILLCFDQETNIINYAAAHNSPLLISDSKINLLQSDKMPVGKGEKKESFTKFTVNYTKGDILYLLTDGYADQFGGPNGKKFKNKPLNELIASLYTVEIKKQQEILTETFENWRGNLEQVDDVCIIGINL